MPSQPTPSNVRQGKEGAQTQKQGQVQVEQPPQVPQTPPVQTAGAQTQATQPAAQPVSQQTTQPQPSPKKSKWWLWVIIIFGILVVLGAIAYFIFR